MVAGAAIAGPVSAVRALDIVLQYDGAQSVNPSFDPQAIGLTIALQQVEALYEDVIVDNYTLTLRYRWVSTPNFTTLADHQLIAKANGREIEGQLRFYAFSGNPIDPRTWFLDINPQDHSEYDMHQTLWRDLTPEEKTGQFDFGANIPETYEVAYWGQAKSTAPIEARTGYDVLSVAAHEVGHGLGLNASSEAQSEAADGDFDFDPAFVNGRTMAADEYGDAAHLWARSLMNPIVNQGRRFLPAMTDVFAMASVNNLVSLDMDRREFWGGSNWNAAGAWAGNRLPSSDDDVIVRDPTSGPLSSSIVMGLTGNGFANNVFVGEEASVSTNAFRLLASGSTIIDGSLTRGGTPGRIRVQPAGELETDNLTLINGGKLDMLGGLADINGALKLGDNNALIDGYGTVDVLSSFNNNGRISASVGALLNFVGGPAVAWDLDGDLETGDLVAVSGNFSFSNGTVSDAFNGSMTIGAGRTMTIGPAWTLGAGGTANLTGSGALLGGGQMTLGGRINATSGAGSISAILLASGTPIVDVATGAVLNVTGSYRTAAGGILTKNGSGSLVFFGAQNHAAGSQLQVNAGTLTLNTDAGASGANLAVVSNANINFGSTQHLASLGVTGGRTQLVPGGSRVLVTAAMTVDTSDALIDVWEHAAIVDYTGGSPLALLKSAIATAYSNANWDGFGITSSLADASQFAVGYAESADLFTSFPASFRGELVDNTSVLIAFARYGDANLDDTTNIGDFSVLAANFNTTNALWSRGDFNYDTTVNIADFALLAGNFNLGVPNDHPRGVPEPGLVAVGALGFGMRMRRLAKQQA